MGITTTSSAPFPARPSAVNAPHYSRAHSQMFLFAITPQLGLAAAMVALSGAALKAQRTPQVLSQSTFEAGGSAACAMAMTSDLRLKTENAQASLLAAPVVGLTPRQASSPALSVEVRSPRGQAWQLRAAGTIGPSSTSCATPSQWSRGWVQVARTLPGGGVAFAWGARSLSSIDPSQDRQGAAISVWQERGPDRFRFDVHSRRLHWTELSRFSHVIQRPDSVRNDTTGGWTRFTRPFTVKDSAQSQHGAETIELRTSWQHVIGRAAIQLSAGGMSNLFARQDGTAADSLTKSVAAQRVLKTQLWLRADADVQLTSAASVLFSAAALPSSTFARVGQRGMVSVGLSLRTSALRRDHATTASRTSGDLEVISALPAAFDSATRAHGDSVTVRLRLKYPSARRIEISGEPFHWKPVSMTRVDDEWWELSLTAAPGTYRVSMRVDNTKWTAPQGWPSIRDEFGSDVALITLR